MKASELQWKSKSSGLYAKSLAVQMLSRYIYIKALYNTPHACLRG